MVLRDSSGQIQTIYTEENPSSSSSSSSSISQLLKSMTRESVICIRGNVRLRPKEDRNLDQATGSLEVLFPFFFSKQKIQTEEKRTK